MASFRVTEDLRHGFPHQPTCLAYDCVQQLLAIGAHNGTVLVLGQCGLVRHLYHLNSTTHIVCMAFGINKGLLLTLCSNGILYFWSITEQDPVILDSLSMEKMNPCLVNWPFDSNWVYVGSTESDIFFINVAREGGASTSGGYKLLLSDEDTIRWNKVAERSGYQRNRPGQVIVITEKPEDHCKLLIAFSKGSCVLWCNKTKEVDKRFVCDVTTRGTTLTSACWVSDTKFVAGYSDGTVVPFDVKTGKNKPVLKLNDGPSRNPNATPIGKLQCVNFKEKWLIYTGGTQPSSASSKVADVISIWNYKKKCSYQQLDSCDGRIVDFICLPTTPFSCDSDVQQPLALAVLTENKLSMVDITSIDFPRFPQQHDTHLHTSPVSVLLHCGVCSPNMEGQLFSLKSKLKQYQHRDTKKMWPLNGGIWDSRAKKIQPQLIVTGHCDGMVKFWLCYHDLIDLCFSVNTAEYYYQISSSSSRARASAKPVSPQHVVEESDSPLAVSLIKVSMEQQTLIVVNEMGHLLLFKFEQSSMSITVKSHEIMFEDDVHEKMATEFGVTARPNAKWKFTAGHKEEDDHRLQLITHCCCYYQKGLTCQQIKIVSVDYSERIEMLVIGTTHGLTIMDVERNDVIDTISSVRKLLRMADPSFSGGFIKRTGKESKRFFSKGLKFFRGLKSSDPGAPTPEPEVENDPEAECCITVLETVYFICESSQSPCPTLWVGTTNGKLCAFQVNFKEGAAICSERLELAPTNVATEKSSPVVGVVFLNDQLEEIPPHTPWSPVGPQQHSPPRPTSDGSPGKDASQRNLDYAILTTKEYIKSYGFPGKKKVGSYSLPKEDDYIEKSSLMVLSPGKPFLLTLIKTGQFVVHSLPDLSSVYRIISTPFTRQLHDPSAQDTFSVTVTGHGAFICSPTEIQRLSVTPGGPQKNTYLPLLFVPRPDPVARRSSRSRSSLATRDDLFGASLGTLRHAQFTRSTPHLSSPSHMATPSHEEHDGGRSTSRIRSEYNSRERGRGGEGGGGGGVNAYQRTQVALHERGDKLNRTKDATANLLAAASAYATTTQRYHARDKNPRTSSQ